ncbi:MAG TPA: iron ABC transporter permease [Gaiellaceae bacterium]|nr:iron ABC transporter permease [Gaiellaceae bacterium]
MGLAAARIWLPVSLAFLAAAMLAGVLVGPVDLGAVNVVRATFAHVFGLHSPLSGSDDAILWELRLPRVILAVLVGGTLAAAGAAYQGVFRNPLADPYLLGAAAGAGLGATVVVVYAPASSLTGDLLPLGAFVGAAIAVIAAYVLGRSAGGAAGPAALVLAGVTIASFLTALQTFVQQQHVDTVQEVYSWLLGRLATSGWREVGIVLPYAVVSWLVIIAHRRLLDVLSVGDDEAAALGVNVARVRLLVVAAATVATAAAVAVAGLIGFVGIIVPHTIRLLVGGSYRLLLPLSVIVGAGFLVFADVIARTILSPAELPIGVVTAFFGAPFFAVVLRTSRRPA